MTKWIIATAAIIAFGDFSLPAFQNMELLRDCALALAVALLMLPWVVSQLEG